jgi:ABC-type sulfate transport system substrate-binding protein
MTEISTLSRRRALTLAAATPLAGLAGAAQAAAPTLLNVSYDPTAALYAS